MKKILLSLIATLCTLSSHAQTIEIYHNGTRVESYTNSPRDHYVVKFTSVGDYDHINGHDYVIIGGLKWATMNVGAPPWPKTTPPPLATFMHGER